MINESSSKLPRLPWPNFLQSFLGPENLQDCLNQGNLQGCLEEGWLDHDGEFGVWVNLFAAWGSCTPLALTKYSPSQYQLGYLFDCIPLLQGESNGQLELLLGYLLGQQLLHGDHLLSLGLLENWPESSLVSLTTSTRIIMLCLTTCTSCIVICMAMFICMESSTAVYRATSIFSLDIFSGSGLAQSIFISRHQVLLSILFFFLEEEVGAFLRSIRTGPFALSSLSSPLPIPFLLGCLLRCCSILIWKVFS